MTGKSHHHGISPAFERAFNRVKEYFFSRNPRYWPCFADPRFADILAFRKRRLSPEEGIAAWPDGPAIHARLTSRETAVPRRLTEPTGAFDAVLGFTAALSKNWEDPASVENVITMPCDPGIYGAMLGSLVNPNLVYRDYAGMAAELEHAVIRQVAQLAGYDVERATGIFTQGGTFCNLYGYLTGIRKSLPQARLSGMGNTPDYRIINSQGGHYSNITSLSLLGVDIRQRAIRIKIGENNEMDLGDLERHLRACFELRSVVPTIMLTMGTTDTFAVDRIKPVYDLRNRLCSHYDISPMPHIHVDSAIGWAMLFFLEYDFANNPLEINPATLAGIRRNVEYFRELKYADSFTVDFQKWGYVPYTSSLILFKDRADLKYLEHDPENFYYFEKEVQGYTHLHSTVECSRGAGGVFGAWAALNYMGIEGYQTVLAHCLQNAGYLRHRLEQLGFVKVIAPDNQGPSVGFRIYNPQQVKDPDAEFAYECRIQSGREYLERLARNNAWHRRVFLERGRAGLFTNWVEFIAHTAYDDRGRHYRLPGEKAVFLNPATTRREIDIYIDTLCRAAAGRKAHAAE